MHRLATYARQLNRLTIFSCALAVAAIANAQISDASQAPTDPQLRAGKQALAEKHFAEAKQIYSAYEHAHPNNIDGVTGLADAELGLHEYEAAELDYRRVVAIQPQRWLAHKNLVIIEAALGRWEEFDRERALLRGARQRGAPGITTRESDVIDSFDLRGSHWIVREYYEPAGRSLTRYNFERFSPEGRVEEYISLESAGAAAAVLSGTSTRTGSEPASTAPITDFALNWYTGHAHGAITRYPKGEPAYERVRADALRWLRLQNPTKDK